MRKLFILLLLSGSCFLLQAQHPGYSPVIDLAKFKEQFFAATQKTTSIKSNFVQEKNLSMLSEKIISKGKFFFLKENKVRMEYGYPFQYLIILNKAKVFIKTDQKENKLSTKSNKLFQQINQIMIDCMQGSALNNANFKTQVLENKTTYLVELSPLTKGLKELLKTVNIIIDKKDYSVNSLQMYEQGGDDTIIQFTNKELNTTLSNALFDIK